MKKLFLIPILLIALFITGCSSNISDTKDQKIKTANKCTYNTTDKCNQNCTADADCKPMTPKLCINTKQKNESDPVISFYTLPNCKCENQKCVVKEDKAIQTPNKKSDKQTNSFTSQINQTLKKGAKITSIKNPNLELPTGINSGQIKKYFKVNDVMLALVLRNSMNVNLSLPANFNPTFTGVLTAKKGDKEWSKLAEIKDVKMTDKNNPYYLTVSDKQLLLTVVDQNGAGSGEGVMKVFTLSESGKWNLKSCYYFGENYNDGDYFAFSVNFAKQKTQPMSSCKNVSLVNVK